VEASVLNYPDAGGISLPDIVFQKMVSEAFEDAVCSLFRKHGFVAGKVTEKGMWKFNDEIINLRSLSDTNIPGEVDVLAYSKDHNLVWICECKVLSYPRSLNGMRNLLLKLNETDTKGFHEKLKRKMLWLMQSKYFEEGTHWIKTLMIDRPTPGMKQSEDFMTFDPVMLEDAIKTELKTKDEKVQP